MIFNWFKCICVFFNNCWILNHWIVYILWWMWCLWMYLVWLFLLCYNLTCIWILPIIVIDESIRWWGWVIWVDVYVLNVKSKQGRWIDVTNVNLHGESDHRWKCCELWLWLIKVISLTIRILVIVFWFKQQWDFMFVNDSINETTLSSNIKWSCWWMANFIPKWISCHIHGDTPTIAVLFFLFVFFVLLLLVLHFDLLAKEDHF